MRERCPVCGLRFHRGEEGYAVGAYMFNMIASELVFAAGFIVIIVATWPSPPWEGLTWAAAICMVLAPIVFYPITKCLFLAFDLIFRPATAEDLR
jgi:ABC-type branched-subunit amino acid transport system permease subunit